MTGVSAIIVTRGNVDLQVQVDALPKEWEVLIVNNARGEIVVKSPGDSFVGEIIKSGLPDLSVYGRYAACEFATYRQIYVQDDDCIVSDPTRITEAWFEQCPSISIGWERSYSNQPYHGVVCNMPERFRHSFYEEHALVGFGASFERDAPKRAFERFWDRQGWLSHPLGGFKDETEEAVEERQLFMRTCDMVFTALTERHLVDVPHEDMPFASDPDRMWKQPDHQGDRNRMLDKILTIR